MKRIALLIFIMSTFTILADTGIGFKWGTDAGLTVISNDIRVDVGASTDNFDNFTLSVDKLFQNDLLYVGIGLKAINQHDFDFGARIPVGVSMRANFLELFGEAVPTYYVDKGFDLEYGLGFRIHF